MSKTTLLSAFFLLLSVAAMPDTLAVQFHIEKVSPRVYTATPLRSNRVSATSTIIVGNSFLTVVESQVDEPVARALIHQIRKSVSKLPIKYLILTHHHLDHTLGTGAFVRENAQISIIAHPYVRKKLQDTFQQDKQAWIKVIQSLAASVQQNSVGFTAENNKRQVQLAQRGFATYIQELNQSHLVLPNLLVKEELEVVDGDFAYQIQNIGMGHSPGDIIIRIPSQKVVVTGDLIHDFEPLFPDANPDNWIQTLNKLEQIDFEFLIGGHGRVQRGKNVLRSWRAYLQELVDKVQKAQLAGETLEHTQQQLTPATLQSLRQDNYGNRIQQAREREMAPPLIGSLEAAVKSEVESLWQHYAQSNNIQPKAGSQQASGSGQ